MKNSPKINYDLLIRAMFATVYESLAYKVSHRIRNSENTSEIYSDYYTYIPSYPDMIGQLLKHVLKENISDKSFIDVGAGTAIIPNLFQILGCKSVCGLEYNEILVALDSSGLLILGDLLTYNFEKYDILYSYNPIRGEKLMRQGIDNIINTMRPGAKFYFQSASGVPLPEFKKLDGHLYLFQK